MKERKNLEKKQEKPQNKMENKGEKKNLESVFIPFFEGVVIVKFIKASLV